MQVPPIKVGTPLAKVGTPQTCYMAGSMPLAFTQEHFLLFTFIISRCSTCVWKTISKKHICMKICKIYKLFQLEPKCMKTKHLSVVDPGFPGGTLKPTFDNIFLKIKEILAKEGECLLMKHTEEQIFNES